MVVIKVDKEGKAAKVDKYKTMNTLQRKATSSTNSIKQ